MSKTLLTLGWDIPAERPRDLLIPAQTDPCFDDYSKPPKTWWG
ncbi:hypothetical protein [Rhodococcus sp. NPDC049939]